jgi:ketosteroid isomerase-like protein
LAAARTLAAMTSPQRPQAPPGRERQDRVVDAWARAEHDADVEEILRLLADDVVLVVVGLDQADLQGRRAVGAWHREQAANALHERDVPVQRVYGWASVLDDVVRESRVTGSLFGFRGGGRRVRYRLRRLFELRDARVARLTVWPDLEALARQLP